MTQPADVRAGIVTRFVGPTNRKGKRVSVTDNHPDAPRRLIVSWDDELDMAENHAAAARAWLEKFIPYDPQLSVPGIYCGKGYAWTWNFAR